jgi:hypothetical protein
MSLYSSASLRSHIQLRPCEYTHPASRRLMVDRDGVAETEGEELLPHEPEAVSIDSDIFKPGYLVC